MNDLIKNKISIICLPKRYIVAILAFFGYMNVFTMRVNLSVAIVTMTANSTTDDQIFDWNSNERGFILAAFYYGYILTLLLGGFTATKYGGHIVFGLGILVNSIACLLTPVVSIYLDKIGLIVIRVIQGIGQGFAYPSCHVLLTHWMPMHEKSRIVSIALSGVPFGTVISNMLSGIFAVNFGWASIFYIFGSIGVFWYIIWVWIVRSSPENDRWMKDEERNFIKENSKKITPIGKTPWKTFFLSIPVWAIIIIHTSFNWGFYTLLSYLPDYLSNALKYDLSMTGIICAIPYVTMAFLTVVAGYIADWLMNRKILSMTHIRKSFIVVNFILQAISLVLLSYTTDRILCVVYIILSTAFGSFTSAALLTNPLDLSPKYAGIILGITNTFGTLPGILSPLVTGFLVQDSTILAEWGTVFMIAAGVYAFGAVIYFFMGNGEIQPWDEDDSK